MHSKLDVLAYKKDVDVTYFWWFQNWSFKETNWLFLGNSRSRNRQQAKDMKERGETSVVDYCLPSIKLTGWFANPSFTKCCIKNYGNIIRWPRGMAWGGTWEGGSGWETRVHLWWMHVDVWQNQYNIVK